MLVVDASVLVHFVLDSDAPGKLARNRLLNEEIAAPDFALVETTSAVRALHFADRISARRAAQAIDDLLATPLGTFTTKWLLPRAWELRHNLTIYDACYVALAEELETALLTSDTRIAGALGLNCEIELLRAGT